MTIKDKTVLVTGGNRGIGQALAATDMTRGSDIPKASPESVALAVFDAIDNGEEEIFPDPASAPLATHWRDSPAKQLERQLAQLTPVSS